MSARSLYSIESERLENNGFHALVQIDLMLKGPDPVGAMRWFDTCGLFSTIFQLPKDCVPAAPQDYGR